MTNEFHIEEAHAEGDVRLLRISGRLDAKSAQMFVARCRELRAQGAKHLLVNLSRVGFVASSGIGILLALTEEAHDAGGTLRLIAPSEPVQSVLDLLNLTQFLSILASEEAAMIAAVGS